MLLFAVFSVVVFCRECEGGKCKFSLESYYVRSYNCG